MKVILLRDVAKIGRRSQVVEVPDGYALNQLIPKKWAEAATPASLKRIQVADAAKGAHNNAEEAHFLAVVETLKKDVLTIPAEPNAQGHLFKAIHEDDIVAAAKVAGIIIDKRWLTIKTPIKSLGRHEIEFRRQGVVTMCEVEVIKK